MKNKVQTGMLASLILFSVVAFGQSSQTASPKSYVDLMINMANTNLNYGADNSLLSDYKKSANGLQAGVSVQSGITSWFSLVSELYFMRKGGKLEAGNPSYPAASSLRLNTIELPVLARFHLGKFYVNAGPSVAYTLSGKHTAGELSQKISFENSAQGFRRFEAGIQAGGGIAFPLKQKRIALDVRYNYGLTNISHQKEMYNRGLMISVLFSKAINKNR